MTTKFYNRRIEFDARIMFCIVFIIVLCCIVEIGVKKHELIGECF